MDVTLQRSRVLCACETTGESVNWTETNSNVAIQQSSIASCCQISSQQQFATDSTVGYGSESQIQASSWNRTNTEPQANIWDTPESNAQQVDQSSRIYFGEHNTVSYPESHAQWDDSRVPEQSAEAVNSEPYSPPNSGTGYQTRQNELPAHTAFYECAQQHQPLILVIVVNKVPISEERPPDDEQKPRRQKKVKRSEGKKKEEIEPGVDQDRPEEVCDCESEPKLDCDNQIDCNIGDLEKTLESILPDKDCLCYLQSLANTKIPNTVKKKKRSSKPAFDRFANPPFVIEPKPCCRSCCNRNYCCSRCSGCCTSCYPWC